ncbi:MAG: DMT family transporter [Bacteroidota bacterium]
MPKKVPIFLAIGLFAISMSPILVRFASEAPALVVVAWRTLFAVLMLLPFGGRAAVREVRQMPGKTIGWILLAGVLLAVHFLTWTESLYHTSVASAAVLVTTSPIFLAIFGFLLLKERLARRTVAVILIAVAGAVLIALGDATEGAFPNATYGNFLASAAALTVTGYLLIGRMVRQGTSWIAYVMLMYVAVAAVVWGVVLVTQTNPFIYSWTFYGICALIALGPQMAGHGSFNYALKYLKAALLGLLSLTEPVVSATAAYFLFGELPSRLAFAGMIVVLGAVAGEFIGALRANRKNAQPAAP